jgi:rhamnogalacturonan endolyase
VLHWHNKDAQYWTKAKKDGTYVSPPMKPGTYAMKLYRNEFLVAEDTVTITAGSSPTKSLPAVASAVGSTDTRLLWRIGAFDGQPFELKNGDKIERMHPADKRMSSWGGNYTVGKSTAKDFPMALFSKQGGVANVNFELQAGQTGEATLRVGTTLSFKGGRPSVKIGSWTGKDPGAPVSKLCSGVTSKSPNTANKRLSSRS